MYGFLFCFVFGLFMALSMVRRVRLSPARVEATPRPPPDTCHPQAEISSPYVTAGGPYFWSGCVFALAVAPLSFSPTHAPSLPHSALAGKLGRYPPFLVGWLIMVSFLGGQCSIALQAMYQVVAMRQMYYYGFDTANTSPTPSQPGQFGVAVAVLVFGAVMSALPMRYLNKVSLASLTWLVLGALTIIIGLPAIAPKGPTPGMNYREDSKFVWASNTYAQNAKINGLTTSGMSGLGTTKGQTAYTMANGLLMAQVRAAAAPRESCRMRSVLTFFPRARFSPPSTSSSCLTCPVTWRRRRRTRPGRCRAAS